MGDTGIIAIWRAFGALALMLHKSYFLPFICGVFFLKTLSVIIQKLLFQSPLKRKYGDGKNGSFLMTTHPPSILEKKRMVEQKNRSSFFGSITILFALN